jgi:hypothetical protein
MKVGHFTWKINRAIANATKLKKKHCQLKGKAKFTLNCFWKNGMFIVLSSICARALTQIGINKNQKYDDRTKKLDCHSARHTQLSASWCAPRSSLFENSAGGS